MTVLWENIIITSVALVVFVFLAVLVVKGLLRIFKTRK